MANKRKLREEDKENLVQKLNNKCVNKRAKKLQLNENIKIKNENDLDHNKGNKLLHLSNTSDDNDTIILDETGLSEDNCFVESFVESDVENDFSDLTQSASKVLSQIFTNVEFFVCANGTQLLPPFPGIYVNDFEEVISTPLTETMASKLIKNKWCKKSKFSNASFHFDASSINIQHPEWTRKLNDLVTTQVRRQLGFNDEMLLEINLSKMFVHRAGVHFTKSSNPYKTKGDKSVVAYLLIHLPSISSGGSLVVSHKRYGQRVINIGSQFNIFFTAFNSDMECEMAKTMTGNRVELLYTLNHVGTEEKCQKPTKNSIEVTDFKTYDRLRNEMFRLMKKAVLDSNEKNKFALFLEEKYEPNIFANKGLSELKGVDASRYNFISFLNEKLKSENQYKFFLVQASNHVEECSYHNNWEGVDGSRANNNFYIWKEKSKKYRINEWLYEETGEFYFRNDKISFDYFNHLIDLKSKKIDFDDSKWWGDGVESNFVIDGEKASREMTYVKYMLVFLPKITSRYDIMLHCDVNLCLSGLLSHPTLSSTIRHNYLEKIFNIEGVNKLALTKNDTLIVDQLVSRLININNLELCQTFIKKALKFEFDVNFAFFIAKLTIHFDWKNLRESFRLSQQFIQYPQNACYLYNNLIKFNMKWTNFFNDLIAPIMNNEEMFMKLENAHDQICLFEIVARADNQTYLNLYENLIKKMNKNSFKRFIHEIGKILDSKHILSSSRVLYNVFNFYLDAMSRKIRSIPQDPMLMPFANMPDHPDVEAFLRSNKSQSKFTFKNMTKASAFQQRYNGYKPTLNYSILIEIGNNGIKSYAHIYKTTEYFKKQEKLLRELKIEYETIKQKKRLFSIQN